MTGAGRPLRFLAILLCGWVGARSYALYQEGGVTALPFVAPVVRAIGFAASPAAAATVRLPVTAQVAGPPRIAPRRMARVSPSRAVRSVTVEPAGLPLSPPAKPAPVEKIAPVVAPEAVPPPIARGRSRWAGSAWVVARGGTASAASGGQLGGSQAGVRLTYAIDRKRRVALSARLSAPLSGRGREGAVGIDWQPTRVPVHIVAEQRIALDGGRGGPMLGVVGGFGPARVAGPVTLEGYGQAGVVHRDRTEPFADGAIRAAYPVASRGGWRLDVGVGSWGGAQRGATRFDVGPSVGMRVPVGGRSLRLAADWRQRVAGDARPGSGPALSIGTDF